MAVHGREKPVCLLAPWLLKKPLPGIDRYRVTGDLESFQSMTSQICKPVLAA